MSDVGRLLEIMARLRDPRDGCPWDLEQTPASIAPHGIEEAYEVEDAIRRDDPEALRDELGDLLLQVVFQARLAEEAGRFDFGGVVDAIADKLVRRHPHVFGEERIETARAQTDAWERHKREERARRGETSLADGIPLGLPALLRARKLLSRAARAGVEAPGVEASARPLAERLASLTAQGDGERAREQAALRDAVARCEERLRRLERDGRGDR
jgi:ATP diphosphatase